MSSVGGYQGGRGHQSLTSRRQSHPTRRVKSKEDNTHKRDRARRSPTRMAIHVPRNATGVVSSVSFPGCGARGVRGVRCVPGCARLSRWL